MKQSLQIRDSRRQCRILQTHKQILCKSTVPSTQAVHVYGAEICIFVGNGSKSYVSQEPGYLLRLLLTVRHVLLGIKSQVFSWRFENLVIMSKTVTHVFKANLTRTAAERGFKTNLTRTAAERGCIDFSLLILMHVYTFSQWFTLNNMDHLCKFISCTKLRWKTQELVKYRGPGITRAALT